MDKTIPGDGGPETGSRCGYWSAGTPLTGDYRVIRRLGQGGMGTVYLVERPLADRTLQFAVKTMIPEIAGNPKRRRSFLRELHTWIDLPDHPNLVACRFFLTIDGILAVFAEYVDGMTLSHWITQHPRASIETLLDFAIQITRGLGCAHANDVVHQDVKPANIMISADGQVKITDFGLARSRLKGMTGSRIDAPVAKRKGKIPGPPASPERTLAVTYGGMTLAYCSPEQARGSKVTFRTDIWSFGLTVLEMFNGGITWELGSLGTQLLNHYLKSGPVQPMPPMPEPMVDLVRDCLRDPPGDRPDSMDEILGRLEGIYRSITGTRYSRPVPECSASKPVPRNRRDRNTSEGGRWSDPAIALRRSLEHAGRPPAIIDRIIEDTRRKRPSGRKAAAVHDIDVFEQAERIYETLLTEGRSDLACEMAALLFNKALAVESCQDYALASVQYSRASQLLENAAGRPERELAARITLNYAVSLYYEGRIDASFDATDRAILLYRRLLAEQFSPDQAARLANAVMNRAVTLMNLGRPREALPFFADALADGEDLVRRFSTDYHWSILGFIYSNYGEALQIIGDFDRAGDMVSQALDIFQVQMDKNNSYEAAYCLGFLRISNSRLLGAARKWSAAITHLDTAIAYIEEQVSAERRDEMMFLLADALLRRSEMNVMTGDIVAAAEDIRRANGILEDLVHRQGLTYYTSHYAAVRLIGAAILDTAGDTAGSGEWAVNAVKLWHQLLTPGISREAKTLPLRDVFRGLRPGNCGTGGFRETPLSRVILYLKKMLQDVPELDWETDFPNLHRETRGI